MADREKVIKGLGDCSSREVWKCSTCKWYDENSGECFTKLAADALELLREQEPVIVRCKDCKHCEYPQSEKDWCKKGHLHGKAENWFCADGERR